MSSKTIRDRVAEFMRDDGFPEDLIDYVEFALDVVCIEDAVYEAIKDGTIVVSDDGEISVGNVTVH